MLNRKVIIPVIAAILVALGVNLDELGIDLNQLAGNNSTTVSTNSNQSTLGTDTGFEKIASDKKEPEKTAAAYKSGKKWSNTTPALNLHHIFEGEINRKGKPVGYHSRPGGIDPDGARLVRVRDKPNQHGVYTATIEIRDGNQWREKFSSFFPDSLSQQQVMDAVLTAYRNSKNKKQQPWKGPSGLGFEIQGYTLSRGDINTAFPIFRR